MIKYNKIKTEIYLIIIDININYHSLQKDFINFIVIFDKKYGYLNLKYYYKIYERNLEEKNF